MATSAKAAPRQAGRERKRYLAFSLAGERYAVEVLRIKEIVEYVGMTPVPTLPPFIRGACNLRGRGVPVLDLLMRFGAGETAIGRRTCVVIVEAHPPGAVRFDVGLLVDSVNEVLDIGAEDIEATPSLGGKVRSDYLRGLGKTAKGFVVLLDVDRLLHVEDEWAPPRHEPVRPPQHPHPEPTAPADEEPPEPPQAHAPIEEEPPLAVGAQ